MWDAAGCPETRLYALIIVPVMLSCSFYGNQASLIKKKRKKSFTFSESALYLTAKINEQGPGRKATQTCISAQWPVLIGSLLEALIYLNAARWRGWGRLQEECVSFSVSERGGERGGGLRYGGLWLVTIPPINNLEPRRNKKREAKGGNNSFRPP